MNNTIMNNIIHNLSIFETMYAHKLLIVDNKFIDNEGTSYTKSFFNTFYKYLS